MSLLKLQPASVGLLLGRLQHIANESLSDGNAGFAHHALPVSPPERFSNNVGQDPCNKSSRVASLLNKYRRSVNGCDLSNKTLHFAASVKILSSGGHSPLGMRVTPPFPLVGNSLVGIYMPFNLGVIEVASHS